jgi:lysozyme
MSKIVEQLILHEGLRLKPYRCTGNKLTIGVGRNYEDNPLTPPEQIKLFGKAMPQKELYESLAKGITREQAIFLLERDIQNSTRDAKSLVPNFDSLSEQRRFVLIDMALNMGRSSLATFRNTLRMINEEKFADASVNMLKSKWAKQVKDRAKRLSIMMRDNLYHDQVTQTMIKNLG